MKVVLVQEVPELGIPGDVKEVKDGYARNYLIPQRLAVAATPVELSRAAARHKAELERRGKLNEEMSAVAQALEAEPLVVEVRVGPGGRLYGSVTAAEIAAAVGARIGREVDRRTVELGQPLRDLGDHPVRVRLAPDVTPTLIVQLQPLGGAPAQATPAPAATDQPGPAEEAAPAGT